MEEQIRLIDDVDLNNAIIDLQVLGVCLKRTVSELPNSTVKEYLLLEITEPVKLNSSKDFYRLQNKISDLITTLESLSGIEEALKLLEEIRSMLKVIMRYLENGGCGEF